MKKSIYSAETAEFEIDGVEYSVQLLVVDETFKMQFVLGNHARSIVTKGIDPELMLNLAKKLLSCATVDGVDIKLEDFARKPLLLDKVVLGALKANMPDFFETLTGWKKLFDGFVTSTLTQKSKLVSEILKSETSEFSAQSTDKQ